VLHPIRVKEHLKHVPEYLVPVSMRSVAASRNNNKKKRRHGAQDGLSQEKKRKMSKSKDPLFAASAAAEGTEPAVAAAPEPERVFAASENPGRSTSGRQRWKEVHKKGKFSNKKSRNAPRVAGSFTKTKRYK
jgi:hypothetical protein